MGHQQDPAYSHISHTLAPTAVHSTAIDIETDNHNDITIHIYKDLCNGSLSSSTTDTNTTSETKMIGNPPINQHDNSNQPSQNKSSLPLAPTLSTETTPAHPYPHPSPSSLISKRLQPLEILRGITIVFMVLVNTQGADLSPQLAHSEWFGYTLTNWVFPNFIFMVGMAVAIVLSPTKLALISQQDHSAIPTDTPKQMIPFCKRHRTRIKMNLRILKRTILLFGLGINLSALELIGLPKEALWVRIPGVLQRISLCYFVLATSVLWAALLTPPRSPPSPSIRIGLPVTCTALWFILAYTVQSTATEPIVSCDYSPDAISPDDNVLPGYSSSRSQLSPQWYTAQAFLDTVLFAKDRNVNVPLFDSEGSISTLMAVVTAWFGWMLGAAVMKQQQQQMWNDDRSLKTLVQKIEKEGPADGQPTFVEEYDSGAGVDPFITSETHQQAIANYRITPPQKGFTIDCLRSAGPLCSSI
ncbi:hypothetical protein BGZ54_008606 [Gamsiella multidivaricata]|nr:hypothetical protein BGZ54_008606 [Gamsiella multidivaricata]